VLGASAKAGAKEAVELTENAGGLLSLVLWFVFGADSRRRLWRAALLALLASLTVVRMVPGALSLVGAGQHRSTVLFVGWFGPRGLASVVFTLIAFDALSGHELARTLTEVTTWTILLSVVAHGLSSGPLAALYGRRIAGAPADAPELADVAPTRIRKRSLG
jgi:NhaP-type Na+/H+ or K+/H+ antiporter